MLTTAPTTSNNPVSASSQVNWPNHSLSWPPVTTLGWRLSTLSISLQRSTRLQSLPVQQRNPPSPNVSEADLLPTTYCRQSFSHRETVVRQALGPTGLARPPWVVAAGGRPPLAFPSRRGRPPARPEANHSPVQTFSPLTFSPSPGELGRTVTPRTTTCPSAKKPFICGRSHLSKNPCTALPPLRQGYPRC
ncbi:hypothetical protein C8035_v000837 [Colletotrichum spinosum]|uniref:Uncharacterized protein n=1 Tax=Colletotrichum spinosum TaxID=1347390 RepID=A0A4R8Q9Z6_9PEZI|nr:hypothetical protein C8035_v000837 [Colletotrichum spinosum]